jgi:predicted Kef-type K+ transport protein
VPVPADRLTRDEDTTAVLFFVSVGMLFDPQVLALHSLQVLTVVALIVLGKSLSALLIVRTFMTPSAPRSRWPPAWRKSASSPSSWPGSA